MQFPCLLPRLTASESLRTDLGSLYLTRLFKGSLKFKRFSLVLLREESERETPESFLLCSLSQCVGPEGCTARKLSKSAGQLTIRRGGIGFGPSLCINLEYWSSEIHVVLLNIVNKAAVTHNWPWQCDRSLWKRFLLLSLPLPVCCTEKAITPAQHPWGRSTMTAAARPYANTN